METSWGSTASRHRNNIRAKFQSPMMQTKNQERTFFFLWLLPPMEGVATFAFGISEWVSE